MLSDRVGTSGRFSNKPLYLQLRDALTERIASGKWRPNTAIPNEGELAREFGVSAGTMRKALDLMEAERLLTRRQGRGTFVNDHSSDELAARFTNLRTPDGQRVWGEVKSAEITEGIANEQECARLRINPDDTVFRLARTREHEGQIFLVEHVALPAALFPGLKERKSLADRIVVLAQEFRVLIGTAEERVSLGKAPAGIAEALGVEPGSTLMVLDRVVLALDGRPIEWRMGWCHLIDKYYLAEMA